VAGLRVIAYRVQAADGRGPWRPGWSHTWIDGDAPPDRLTETVMDLVPVDVLMRLPKDMAWGSACRTLDTLMQWFTPVERERLRAAGYHPVKLTADVVLAESAWQMVIGRARPFAEGATRLRWP
jgi:hypothetical protein